MENIIEILKYFEFLPIITANSLKRIVEMTKECIHLIKDAEEVIETSLLWEWGYFKIDPNKYICVESNFSEIVKVVTIERNEPTLVLLLQLKFTIHYNLCALNAFRYGPLVFPLYHQVVDQSK